MHQAGSATDTTRSIDVVGLILALRRLPDPDRRAPDYADPAAVQARQDRLAEVARAAGAATVELLLRARELHQRGLRTTHLDPVASAWVDAMTKVHPAICRFDEAQGRLVGLELALAAIEQDAGSGVATIVLGVLERVWVEFDRDARERISADLNL